MSNLDIRYEAWRWGEGLAAQSEDLQRMAAACATYLAGGKTLMTLCILLRSE